MPRAALALALLAGAAGCSTLLPTPLQHLSESASDANSSMQFGRLDVALDNVLAKDRDDFKRRHAAWGHTIRIVDVEMDGIAMEKKGTATVTVTVSWQRLNESTMRVSEIAQHWDESTVAWHIVGEEIKSGDEGLLAEPAKGPVKAASAALQARPSYQTHVIYEQ
jgi:hypothetical protein